MAVSKKTPENAVKDRVKKLIDEVCKRRGLAYRIDWHAGSQFTTTLDATGVVAGHPFVCEVKRFDTPTQPTARQKLVIREFIAAGARVHTVVDEGGLAYLRLWLETLEPRYPHE
jgi:hypothetical protein